MPIEIEAKMKVDDLGEERRKLRECGAAPLGRVLEVNTFFDTPQQSLYHAGKGLRVRTSTDAASNRSTHVITFKGPRQPGALKKREEIEVAVADADAAIALLKALGHIIVISFEKRRESWKLDGCRI